MYSAIFPVPCQQIILHLLIKLFYYFVFPFATYVIKTKNKTHSFWNSSCIVTFPWSAILKFIYVKNNIVMLFRTKHLGKMTTWSWWKYNPFSTMIYNYKAGPNTRCDILLSNSGWIFHLNKSARKCQNDKMAVKNNFSCLSCDSLIMCMLEISWNHIMLSPSFPLTMTIQLLATYTSEDGKLEKAR